MLVSLKFDYLKLSDIRKGFETKFPETPKEVIDKLFHLENCGIGLYRANHWNFPLLFSQRTSERVKVEELDDALYPEIKAPSYGVCDSPMQFLSHHREELRNPDRSIPPLLVDFVEILKSEQPSEGGWRWEKWGPYTGYQEPKSDYLFDEPRIKRVFTFSLFEVSISDDLSTEEDLSYYSDISIGS